VLGLSVLVSLNTQGQASGETRRDAEREGETRREKEREGERRREKEREGERRSERFGACGLAPLRH